MPKRRFKRIAQKGGNMKNVSFGAKQEYDETMRKFDKIMEENLFSRKALKCAMLFEYWLHSSKSDSEIRWKRFRKAVMS